MKNDPVKIVVTGPESTGKTGIASHLSAVFKSPFIPEYARSYVEGLKRPYSYEDVEHIARVQQEQFEEMTTMNESLIILDTYLVITKIWFREVYGRIPGWIDQKLPDSGIDLFLLCYYDIRWVKDPVRENPGYRRKDLFDQYRREIEHLGIPFFVVKGSGNQRFKNAESAILYHFPHLKYLMQ